jgi:F-type H+-transporting ATPase subunit gamma
MATLKEIKRNLETIRIMKELASAYQEIANLRMKQIRETVLRNREFFKELTKTYSRIRAASLLELKRKKIKRKVVKKRKGEIVVFLAANESLYGNLILNIWKEVEKYLEKSNAHLVVIGRIGKYLAERSGFGMRMFYFELDDVNPQIKRIGEIGDFLKDYQKVIVFYGKYEGGLIQKPAMEEISGKVLPEEKIKKAKRYLFEPSPQAILEFFETEILTVLFNLTLLEHQLARYAARVMAMSDATERAKKLVKKYQSQETKLKRQIWTKKQIEIFGNLIS